MALGNSIIKTTNANCYLNGQNLMGKVDEVSLPEIKPMLKEYKPLGMQGAIELPSGFETMELKLKFNALYTQMVQQTANFNTVNNVMVNTIGQEHESLTGLKQHKMTVIVNGIFKNLPLGTYKQNEIVEGIDIAMTVQSLVVNVNGVPTVEIDVINNIYRIGPTDLLNAFRQLI